MIGAMVLLDALDRTMAAIDAGVPPRLDFNLDAIDELAWSPALPPRLGRVLRDWARSAHVSFDIHQCRPSGYLAETDQIAFIIAAGRAKATARTLADAVRAEILSTVNGTTTSDGGFFGPGEAREGRTR